MGESSLPDHDELIMRLSRDLVDSYDEELEMEVEDRHPLPGEAAARILPRIENIAGNTFASCSAFSPSSSSCRTG